MVSRCSVCVCVCIVSGCFYHLGCGLHWDGCVTVAMLCCHLRGEMRVWDVMSSNAVLRLHVCCGGLGWGDGSGTKPDIVSGHMAVAGDVG